MQDARVGLVLENRYRIEEWIAAGGTGVIYRGTDLELGKSLAIKFLHQSGVDSPSRLKRFHHEAEAMSRLTHPSLATIIGFGSHQGVPFLVMEFYEGSSLRQALDSGPIGVPRAINIVRQILAGLASAHDAGVVHRDLKPANVLLAQSLSNDHVKVLDFGVAKLLGDDKATEVSVTAGEPKGTVQYMSPEQARGKPITPLADIYAVGIILYEMTTGQRPFDKGVGFAVLRQQVEDEPQPPRELNPAMSPELEVVILKAMAKEPGDRFQSAALMAVALAVVPEASPPEERRSKSRTRRGIGIRLVALLLAFAGTLGFAGWTAAENGWIEVPTWSPWRPSSEPAIAHRPPPMPDAAPPAPDASVDAPTAPPPFEPPAASIALGASAPRPALAPMKLRGTLVGKRFVTAFARVSVVGDIGTLTLASVVPEGDACESSLENAIEIVVPRAALSIGGRVENGEGAELAIIDASVRRALEGAWRFQLSKLDAVEGIATGEVRLRDRDARLSGKFTAIYCSDPRDVPGERPQVNGVEWNPDQPIAADSLPRAAVAGAIGATEFHPGFVRLKDAPDRGSLLLSFFAREPAEPCGDIEPTGAGLLLTLKEATLEPGYEVSASLATGAPHRARFEHGAPATVLALRIDGIDSLGIRGRIAVAASDRRRSLLAGAFLARDCRRR